MGKTVMATTTDDTQDSASIKSQSKKRRGQVKKRKLHNTASVNGSTAPRETPDAANEQKTQQSPLKPESASMPAVSTSNEHVEEILPSQKHSHDNVSSTPPPLQNATTNGTPKSPFKTPLRIQTAPSSSQRQVVEFSYHPDEDDSSDEDFTPSPSKRRKLKALKSGHSPSRLVTSPRKVHNKDQLQQKKRDLLEERRKLPIWSGKNVPAF
jgi:hypothetical protein